MKNKNLLYSLYASLFAALVFVATMVVQIPTPTGGYVNIGDCMVLLCGFVLGPIWGTIAAGIGSMLVDMMGAYIVYAPATLVIKALVALCACVVVKLLNPICGKNGFVAYLFASIIGEAVMVYGYFAFEANILGLGVGAAAGIPGNVVQAVVGVTLGTVLMVIFQKTKLIEKMLGKKD